MRLLDLFCCEGGASMGYSRAGFDVYGVDLFEQYTQKRYPFPSHKGDAILALTRMLAGEEIPFAPANKGETIKNYRLLDFDAIAASPPCQAYSITKHSHSNIHPDLLGPVRWLLRATGLPYVMENVPGAPLETPLTLCGTEFDLVAVDLDGRPLQPEAAPTVRVQPLPCRVRGLPLHRVQASGHRRRWRIRRGLSRQSPRQTCPPRWLHAQQACKGGVARHRLDDPARTLAVDPPGLHRTPRSPGVGPPRARGSRMTNIPQQPLGSDTCKACGEPIRLINTQLGPEWRHGDSPWCGPAGTVPTTKAVPAGRPWPEAS